MKSHPLLAALAALLLAGCSKSGSDSSTQAGAAAPAPKRNLSESLGFASEESGSYFESAPKSAAKPGAPAPVPNSAVARTLTGKDGRTLEALLLSRTETTVKIRRKADAAEFVIPLDKLSDSDRSFIKQTVPLSAK